MKSTKDLGGEARRLGGDLKKLEQANGAVDSFRRLKLEGDETARKLDQAQGRVKELAGEMRKAEKPTAKLTEEFEQAKRKAAKLKQLHGSQSEKLERLRRDLAGAGMSTRKLASDSRRLNGELTEQRRKLERVADAQRKLTRAREDMDRRLGSAGKMALTGAGMLGAGYGIKRVALDGPIGGVMEFGEAVSNLGSISRASDDDLEKLAGLARKVGPDFRKSASETVAGMSYLAMAGFKTDEIEASIESVMALSNAGKADLARTSDISSDILSGFKLNADEMPRVADTLTATITTANTDLELLGDTMKYVGPVAQKAGMSLEETAAMAGLLGNVGIKGSQAGTSLRTIMQRLASPTSEAASRLADLGVEVRDADGNVRNIIDVMGDLAGAVDGMGSGEQLEIFKTLFDAEAATAAVELIEQEGAEGITKYLAVVRDAHNLARDISDKQGDNLGGDWKKLTAVAGNLSITLGDALEPTMRSLVQTATTAIQAIDAFAQEWPTLTKWVGLLAAGLAGVTAVGGSLLIGLSGLRTGLAVVRYAFTAAGVKANALGGRMDRTGAAADRLGGRMARANNAGTRRFSFGVGRLTNKLRGLAGIATRLGSGGILSRLDGAMMRSGNAADRAGRRRGGGLLGGFGRGRGLLGKVGRLAGKAFKPLGLLTGGLAMADAVSMGDAKGAGREMGGMGGGLAGAAIGAAAGSFVPVIGTAIGGLIGGLAGSFGGEWLGEMAGGLFDGGKKKAAAAAVAAPLAAAAPAALAAPPAAPLPPETTNVATNVGSTTVQFNITVEGNASASTVEQLEAMFQEKAAEFAEQVARAQERRARTSFDDGD